VCVWTTSIYIERERERDTHTLLDYCSKLGIIKMILIASHQHEELKILLKISKKKS